MRKWKIFIKISWLYSCKFCTNFFRDLKSSWNKVINFSHIQELSWNKIALLLISLLQKLITLFDDIVVKIFHFLFFLFHLLFNSLNTVFRFCQSIYKYIQWSNTRKIVFSIIIFFNSWTNYSIIFGVLETIRNKYSFSPELW